jgi:hypothetical protein
VAATVTQLCTIRGLHQHTVDQKRSIASRQHRLGLNDRNNEVFAKIVHPLLCQHWRQRCMCTRNISSAPAVHEIKPSCHTIHIDDFTTEE